MQYRSSISIFNKVILYAIIILLIGVIISSTNFKDTIAVIISFIINGSCIGLLFWILINTKYTIKNSQINCYSGPFKKTIKIDTINRIDFHDGIIIPVSLKLALNSEGIIIRYNKFDDIYISPKQNKKFINELIAINPNIQIINPKNEF
ncbi:MULTISPECIES: PH domain-containing protein [Flavobacterium]|uniref:PH domain-containing protein n=1 Tax=Flavobacterium jumunjinense TaxID=998845 RepID=A0ABV5GLT1_9FLAO|nr:MULTISPECIES: PH domain-containing protein [Flavobacterium]